MPAALPGRRAPRRRGPRGNCHHTKRRTPGSASHRPSRGQTWRPGRIVPGRTRLRGRQNRATMRKPTDTPEAEARTILPGRQNQVRTLDPTHPRPRRGAPVQQIRTHPAPQAPYTPLRHTRNNLPGRLFRGVWRPCAHSSGQSPRPSCSASSKPPLNDLPVSARSSATACSSSPAPGGSRFGDVTRARIVRGGLARIERRWISSSWARIVRAEVDFGELSSHGANRARRAPARFAPAGFAPAPRGRRPARAEAPRSTSTSLTPRARTSSRRARGVSDVLGGQVTCSRDRDAGPRVSRTTARLAWRDGVSHAVTRPIRLDRSSGPTAREWSSGT